MSSHMQRMLDDCFPSGIKLWLAKDLDDVIDVNIAKVINQKYFFGHVTTGVPVSLMLNWQGKLTCDSYILIISCNPG